MSLLFQLRVVEVLSSRSNKSSKAAREGIGVLTKLRQKVQASEPNARGKLMPPQKRRKKTKANSPITLRTQEYSGAQKLVLVCKGLPEKKKIVEDKQCKIEKQSKGTEGKQEQLKNAVIAYLTALNFFQISLKCCVFFQDFANRESRSGCLTRSWDQKR